jgi:polysaccharide pyruvyl transferase WcaK-like protein
LAISFFSTFPLLATILDKPLMMSAVGVGPLLSDAGRHYTYLAFDQAWISTVRDIDSRELMLSLCLDKTRIKVTADPAHLIIPSYRESVMKLIESEGFSPSGERFIAVALRNWDIGVEQEKWSREVANALDSIIERHKAEVLFLPFQRADEQSTDDYAISKSVRSLMRNQRRTFVLERDYTPEERIGIFAHCDIVLGMRLHSIILAANAQVPVLGLVYDPKVRNVMRQLGCEEYAIDLSAATAVDLLRLFEDAYRNCRKISAKLQSASQTLRQLANQNAALALELLDNPARYKPVLSRETVDLLKGTTIKLAIRAETNIQTIQILQREREEVREHHQSEKEQVVNQLTARLTKQEQILESLSARMREQEQEIQTLASQFAKAEQDARDLSLQLATKERDAQVLLQQMATKERDAQVLLQQMATKERDANFLSAQLSAKDYELRKITN